MDKLISDEYRELNEQCHNINRGWGKGGVKFIDTIEIISGRLAPDTPRILDYGCGKGDLVTELVARGYTAQGYDPAWPTFAVEPEGQFDLVVCTDVLEHVEPELLDNVLEHIHSLAHVAYFVVGTKAAVKHLPDGRNAHLTIRDGQWWKGLLAHWYLDIAWIEVRPTTSEYIAYV